VFESSGLKLVWVPEFFFHFLRVLILLPEFVQLIVFTIASLP